MGHLEPLIVHTMLQSKLETEMGIPEEYSQLNIIQKEMLVNSTPKLSQHEDFNIGAAIQLFRNDKLRKYVAKEIDSSGM